MTQARLTVAYDGREFHGFAANPGVRTVMGDLSAAVATVVRRPVDLTGAGRTTPACTPGARSSRVTCPTASTSPTSCAG